MTMGRSLITSQADLAELDRRYRRAVAALGVEAAEARPVAG
jgi:hypothetical protein